LVLILRKEYRLRVFENRVLRRTFRPKRDELTGEWRKWHNGELHNFCSLPDIMRQIKSRRMRWVGYVERMGEQRKLYKVLVGKRESRNHLEDRRVDGRMVLDWITGRLIGGKGCGADSPGTG
jgi:hypothetical protein